MLKISEVMHYLKSVVNNLQERDCKGSVDLHGICNDKIFVSFDQEQVSISNIHTDSVVKKINLTSIRSPSKQTIVPFGNDNGEL